MIYDPYSSYQIHVLIDGVEIPVGSVTLNFSDPTQRVIRVQTTTTSSNTTQPWTSKWTGGPPKTQFKTQPYIKKTKFRLVTVPPESAPKGQVCQVCHKRARAGQSVFYIRMLVANIDLFIPEVGVVIHEPCMASLLGTEPEIIGTKAEVEYEYNRQAREIAVSMDKDTSL